MIVIPAIDLLDGRCVRLVQGDYAAATRYPVDPAEVARSFEEAGIRRIHIVDLDAAKGGGKNNRETLRKIRKATSCTIEIGGGIRTEDDVKELIDLGADRLILGTILAKAPETASAWTAKYGKRFMAGIDAKDGMVKVSGWLEEGATADTDLARRCAAMGVCSIVYTNIAKDGMLGGPDVERTNLIAREAGIPVILSGGIGTTEHLDLAARKADPLVVAAITGKAVYEGRIDLAAFARRNSQHTAADATW